MLCWVTNDPVLKLGPYMDALLSPNFSLKYALYTTDRTLWFMPCSPPGKPSIFRKIMSLSAGLVAAAAAMSMVAAIFSSMRVLDACRWPGPPGDSRPARRSAC